jgi:thioredoxin 1
MSEINHISDDSFQNDVLQADKPVLVDFTAVWCGPCKMLDPVVKQLAQEWAGKVKIVKLDVDSNPNVTMEYQVMGLPTLIMFVNGQPVERVPGYQPKERLINKFSPYIN